MFQPIAICLSVLHGAAKGKLLMVAKHRITVNLDDDDYEALIDIATRADRSIAWVGRQAIVQFISSQEREEVPLLAAAGTDGASFGKSSR